MGGVTPCLGNIGQAFRKPWGGPLNFEGGFCGVPAGLSELLQMLQGPAAVQRIKPLKQGVAKSDKSCVVLTLRLCSDAMMSELPSTMQGLMPWVGGAWLPSEESRRSIF